VHGIAEEQLRCQRAVAHLVELNDDRDPSLTGWERFESMSLGQHSKHGTAREAQAMYL